MLETDALLLLEDREGAARCGGCLVGRVAEVGRLERPMRAEVESALLYFEQG